MARSPPRPLSIESATVYGWLHADHDALQALVDSQLNAASSPTVRYEAVGHSVLLIVLQRRALATSQKRDRRLAARPGDDDLGPAGGEVRPGSRLMIWIPYLDRRDERVGDRSGVWGYRKSRGALEVARLPPETLRVRGANRRLQDLLGDTPGTVERW